MAVSGRPISEVFQDIVRNIQEIIRSEVRLAKAELGEETVKAKAAAPSLGVGALSGFFAGFFLLLAAVSGLTRVMPDWAAALVVGVVLAFVSGIALNVGFRLLRQVHAVPDRTIESMKENIQWAQQQTK